MLFRISAGTSPPNDIRYSESSTWFEDAERLLQHTVFVAREIDDAIRHDHVYRAIGQWNIFDFTFKEFYIRQPRLAFVLLGDGKHFICHVEAERFSGWPDALRSSIRSFIGNMGPGFGNSCATIRTGKGR
jgi:hypothetical protein